MKFYLAAQYSRRAELFEHARALQRAGHVVTSRWLEGAHASLDGDWRDNPALARSWAKDDLVDIDAADVLIAFTEAPGVVSRGGRHVEWGYAVGKGKSVAIVGPVENIFYIGAMWFETWGDLMLAVSFGLTVSTDG